MPTVSEAPWNAPYLQNLWSGATQVANRPYQQYQGPRVAGMSSLQENALGGIQSAMYGNPVTWGGYGLLGDIIGGSANPQLDTMANTITSDATNAFQSQLGQLNDIFSNPNSFGGARHELGANKLTESFGRGLGQSLGALRYGAFDTEMSRRMAAAQQAQGMTNSSMNNLQIGLQAGGLPRAIQQQQYDTGYNDWQNWWQYPMQQSQFLGSMFGLGGNAVSRTTPDPSRASQILGGGLTALQGLYGMGAFGGGAATPTQDLMYGGQPLGGYSWNPAYG